MRAFSASCGPAFSTVRAALRSERMKTLNRSLIGSLATQALGIVTGLLLARGLGPHDRGAVAAMILWPTVCVAVGELGLGSSFTFYTARGKYGVQSLARYAGRASSTQTLYLVPIGLLVSWLALSHADVHPLLAGLVLASVLIPGSLWSRYVAAILQGQARMLSSFTVRLAMASGTAITLAVLTVAGTMTTWSAIIAYLVGLAAMMVVCWWHVRHLIRGFADADNEKPRSKEFLRYGLRALPGGLYPVEILFIDQMLVALFLGPYELGLYVTAVAFTTLPRIIATGLGSAAIPLIAREARGKTLNLTAGLMALAFAVIVPVCLLLALVLPWLLPVLFGTPFEGAVPVGQLLLAGSCAYALRRVLGDCLRGLGKPGRVSVVEVASWPVIVVAAAVGATLGLEAIAVGLAVVQLISLLSLVTWLVAGRAKIFPRALG